MKFYIKHNTTMQYSVVFVVCIIYINKEFVDFSIQNYTTF